MRIVRQSTRSVSWVDEETLAPIGKQSSIDHDVGPRTSKSSSPFEDPDSRILRGYCGAKGSGDSGPFDINPKAHAEEEEVPEDERRESRPPNCTAEDDPICDKPKSWERKASRRPRQSGRRSQKRFQAIWASYRRMGERQPQEEPPPPY